MLIVLKRTLSGRRQKASCDTCQEPLRHSGPGAAPYWCPRCKVWHFTDLAILARGTKRGHKLIDNTLAEGSQSMDSINKKIDTFLKQRKEEMTAQAKVYTKDDWPQSFLETLVPSLWRIK